MTRALLLALMLSACASSPAPISYGGGATAPRQREAQPAPAPRPHADAPAPDWAEGEGTPLSAYALQPEDAQPYDPANLPRSHRVGVNQSLYDIASLYQVPLRALIEQNRLEPPYALSPGRELQLPPPRTHRVARGESFEDVARAYNVDRRSLALLNRMAPPYNVREGDAIVLPALARAHASPPPPASAAVAAPAAPIADARFVWPLRGEITARFGVQPNGVRVDGLEIASQEGASIVAAGDGDVVYAGSDLPGYGALVLVRHADNYVTAYGYTRRTLVREGQRVRQGEPVAEAGTRLMFQVRRGAAAIDPLPLLR